MAGLEAGGVDYVTKPVKARELIAHRRAPGGARRARHQASQSRQARNALDAFGYASVTARANDGRLLWTTPLARDLLQRYFGADAAADALAPTLPEPVAQYAAACPRPRRCRPTRRATPPTRARGASASPCISRSATAKAAATGCW